MEQFETAYDYKARKGELINLERGKIPPQAVDLEEVVLGAMLIDKKGVDEAVDILSPEAFYKEAHGYILKLYTPCLKAGSPLTY